MALNKLMHPRNPYKKKRPDFMALALKYPKFKEQVTTDLKGKVTLDFKNPDCLRALSWALLKDDFDLDVDMPSNRLVPTIPQRLNYILWLEDLLEGTDNSTVYGIDIGSGASCVYALLGARKNQWKFLVSEADPVNVSYALQNVNKNNMHNKIKVQQVSPDSGLADLISMQDDPTTTTVPACSESANATVASANISTAPGSSSTDSHSSPVALASPTAPSSSIAPTSPTTLISSATPSSPPLCLPPGQRYSFCMCNPPFFSSADEACGAETTRHPEDRPRPMSTPTGSPAECITPGGEVDYVAAIIRDSMELGDRVRIYTTLLGKKSSVGVLKECLKQNGIHNFGSTEFCQGRTMRWALGWSFDPTVKFPLPPSKSMSQQKPKPPMTMVLPQDVPTVTAGWTRLLQLLHNIQVSVAMEADSVVRKRAKITAQRNTWTHQRRQRRQKRQQQPQQQPQLQQQQDQQQPQQPQQPQQQPQHQQPQQQQPQQPQPQQQQDQQQPQQQQQQQQQQPQQQQQQQQQQPQQQQQQPQQQQPQQQQPHQQQDQHCLEQHQNELECKDETKHQQQQQQHDQQEQQHGRKQQQEQQQKLEASQEDEPPRKKQRLQPTDSPHSDENSADVQSHHSHSSEIANSAGAWGGKTINGNRMQKEQDGEGDSEREGSSEKKDSDRTKTVNEKNVTRNQASGTIEKTEVEEDKNQYENSRDQKLNGLNPTEGSKMKEKSTEASEMDSCQKSRHEKELSEKYAVSQGPDNSKNPTEKTLNCSKTADVSDRKNNDQGNGDIVRKNTETKLCVVPKEDVMATPKEDVVAQCPVLEADVVMKQSDKYIMLELQLQGGKGDREMLHQVLQYIKNSW